MLPAASSFCSTDQSFPSPFSTPRAEPAGYLDLALRNDRRAVSKQQQLIIVESRTAAGPIFKLCDRPLNVEIKHFGAKVDQWSSPAWMFPSLSCTGPNAAALVMFHK